MLLQAASRSSLPVGAGYLDAARSAPPGHQRRELQGPGPGAAVRVLLATAGSGTRAIDAAGRRRGRTRPRSPATGPARRALGRGLAARIAVHRPHPAGRSGARLRVQAPDAAGRCSSGPRAGRRRAPRQARRPRGGEVRSGRGAPPASAWLAGPDRRGAHPRRAGRRAARSRAAARADRRRSSPTSPTSTATTAARPAVLRSSAAGRRRDRRRRARHRRRRPREPGAVLLRPAGAQVHAVRPQRRLPRHQPVQPRAAIHPRRIQDLVAGRPTSWTQVPGATRTDAISAGGLVPGTGARSVFVDRSSTPGRRRVPAAHVHYRRPDRALRADDAVGVGVRRPAYTEGLHIVPYPRASRAPPPPYGPAPTRRPPAQPRHPRAADRRGRTVPALGPHSPTARRVIATRYVPAS